MAHEVAVCICTRNRPRQLAAAIDSVLASRTKPCQIIVSDDSTEGRTAELVAGSVWRDQVTYAKGPRRGLGANRNRALATVLADYVLFLDDDARLLPDTLGTLVNAASLRPGAVLTGEELRGDEARRVEPRRLDGLGFQSIPYGPDDKVETIVINATLFPTSLVKQAMFDDQLVYGYDEVDVAGRLVQAGCEILRIPDAKVLHIQSDVNREYYAPYRDASRIYVSWKLWYMKFGRSRAARYVLRASFHLYASRLCREGPGGMRSARATLRVSGQYMRNWLAARGAAGRRPTRVAKGAL